MTLHILTAIGGALCSLLSAHSLSVNDVVWSIANAKETPAETCARQNMKALFTRSDDTLVWNQTAFNTVVNDILELQVSSEVSNSFGIKSCCVAGLWCDDSGCFTQGYSSSFSNYGWLNGDNSSVPVYACYGDNTENGITIEYAQFQGNGALIDVLGENFSDEQGVSDFYIYQESCNNVELCNCRDCSTLGDAACLIGERCFQYTFESEDRFNCFVTCSDSDDASCPCGQSCSATSDSGVFICLPSSTDIYVQECDIVRQSAAEAGRLTCEPQRAFQEQFESDISNGIYDLSILVEGFSNADTFTNLTRTSGFCESDADCADGNLCTLDECDSASQLCSYKMNANCSSMPRVIVQRQAPYMYYNYYRSGSSSLSNTQATSVNLIIAQGTNFSTIQSMSTNEDNEDDDDDNTLLYEVKLPFSVSFMGTTVDTGYIGSPGVLALPPLIGSCDNPRSCFIFSSGSNIIAPWFSSWADIVDTNSSSGEIYVYDANESTAVFGSSMEAYHVLFYKMQLAITSINGTTDDNNHVTNDNPENTFAISLYPDGSIKLSYIDITSAANISSQSDFLGLWGSYVSDSSYSAFTASPATGSFLRYHSEELTSSQILSGSEAVYCLLNTVACPLETCIAAGESLEVSWAGSSTCSALGGSDVVVFEYTCAWAGGAATSSASLNNNKNKLSCTMPGGLDFEDGSMITVDIIVTAVDASVSSSVISGYSQNANDIPGSKNIYSVNLGGNNELTRTPLLVHFYSASGSKPAESCGCGDVTNSTGSGGAQCDAFGVCGGTNTTADCNGDAFGSAITIAACSSSDADTTTDTVCAGGATGIVPDFSCSTTTTDDDNGDSGGSNGSGSDNTSAIVSQTIILLMIICCMTFITMALSYSIRRMMAIRALNESLAAAEAEVLQFEMSLGAGGAGGGAAQRGLSEFECDALGEVKFSKAFYKKHLEQQALLHKTHAAAGGSGVMAAAGASAGTDDGAVDVESGSGVPVGAAAAAAGGGGDTCDCAICLCEIEENSVCRVLPDPCGHIFHKKCIDQWFKQSSACPMCKRSMRAILVGDDEIHVFNASSVGTAAGSAGPTGGSGGSGGAGGGGGVGGMADGNRPGSDSRHPRHGRYNNQQPPLELYGDDYGREVRYARSSSSRYRGGGQYHSPPRYDSRAPQPASTGPHGPHPHRHPHHRNDRPPPQQQQQQQQQQRQGYPTQGDGYDYGSGGWRVDNRVGDYYGDYEIAPVNSQHATDNSYHAVPATTRPATPPTHTGPPAAASGGADVSTAAAAVALSTTNQQSGENDDDDQTLFSI